MGTYPKNQIFRQKFQKGHQTQKDNTKLTTLRHEQCQGVLENIGTHLLTNQLGPGGASWRGHKKYKYGELRCLRAMLGYKTAKNCYLLGGVDLTKRMVNTRRSSGGKKED